MELQTQFAEEVERLNDEIKHFDQVIQRLHANVKDKEGITELTSNSLRDLEAEYEMVKGQLSQSRVELNESLRKKNKVQEEMSEKLELFRAKEESLLEELELLRNYQRGSQELEAKKDQEVPSILAEDLREEPNWKDLYEKALKKWNRILEEEGSDLRLTLPSRRFHHPNPHEQTLRMAIPTSCSH